MNVAAQENARWRSVCERDGSARGAFVYAVRTTGVYCSPGCATRRPRRENVLFYDAPRNAELAGYRPCRRCRPHEEEGAPPHADAVARACRVLREAEEEPGLARLARDAGLSPGYFQRLFKKQIGLSPKEYARAARRERLRDGLGNAESVSAAIYAAGYGSASRAYADKSAALSLYRRGAKGEVIFHAVADTSLGEILVAMTEGGVCLVEFLDSREREAALRRRFPLARLQAADARQAAWVGAVVAYVDGAGASANGALPLEIRGTAFQEKVWRALREIPSGETRSYGELARRIGHPTSARAVGAACGANPIAVVIPCHRVVGASGALTGYRWGVARKEVLLRRERGAGGQK